MNDNVNTGIVGIIFCTVIVSFLLVIKDCSKESGKNSLKQKQLYYKYLESHPGCEVKK